MEIKEPTQEYKESIEAAARRGEPIEYHLAIDPVLDNWTLFPRAQDYCGDFNWKHFYFRVVNPPRAEREISMEAIATESGELVKYRKGVECSYTEGAEVEFRNNRANGYPLDWEIWDPTKTHGFDWVGFNYRVKAQTAMDNIKTAQETVDKAIGMVEAMLSEREKTHGNFRDHARCTQRLKSVLREELEIMGKPLTMEQEEALDMIFHKIGRIVAGNANFVDHWDDLAGYPTLVAKILREEL